MHIRNILAIGFVLLLATPMSAQKKQKAKPKKAPVQVKQEPTAADLLYENMLSSIQRVMIIDSVVVERDGFIQHIPLPPDCGAILSTAQFLNGNQQGTAFVNEFGNKAYFSATDNEGHSQLLTTDRLQNKWSSATLVEGVDQTLSPCNPFMMPDGITLYFAQQGEESLGGYDIFVTRYDSEDQRFFQPENIGLPFNSKANDYMYVEDELNQLAWFVTDRNQPEGFVCIYTFVPTKKRVNINTDDMEDDEIESLAAIRSIKDSWTDMAEYQAALNRLDRLREQTSKQTATKTEACFVVNDLVVYSAEKQFRSNEARATYSELLKVKTLQQNDEQQLEGLRQQYHEANAAKRQQLTSTILALEKKVEQQADIIKHLEKAIRNAEIPMLRN